MKATKKFLKDMARNVRQWVEEEDMKYPYQRPTMQGFCGIASAELSRRLEKEGIEHEICMATDMSIGSHVFVVVDDHIYDVTATQFAEYSRKPIVIIHTKEAEANWYHRPVEHFKNAKQLRKFQIKNRWPKDQTAYAT